MSREAACLLKEAACLLLGHDGLSCGTEASKRDTSLQSHSGQHMAPDRLPGEAANQLLTAASERVLLLQMQQMDDAADEQFSNDVASAIVDWVAQRMSDYHKNFHDTSLMQARLLAMGPMG